MPSIMRAPPEAETMMRGVEDGVVEASLLLGFGETAFVRLEVGELERVGGLQVEIDELIPWFEQVGDARAGVKAEVVAALGADLEVGFEVCFEDGLMTGAAFRPQALGPDGLGGVVDNLRIFAFEPAHCGGIPLLFLADYCTGA
jgi:hypothetical protein